MKKWLALWLLIGRCLLSSAQLYDAQWVIGDRESVLDFRNDTLTNYAIGPEMHMFLTSAWKPSSNIAKTLHSAMDTGYSNISVALMNLQRTMIEKNFCGCKNSF